MGYGEFGGNGSVHWQVRHEAVPGRIDPPANGRSKGKDPIESGEMGTSKGAPAGHFRVDLIYTSPADAQAALQSAAVQGASLVLFVRANTIETPAETWAPAQIRVSW
jgi:hypothetical protein